MLDYLEKRDFMRMAVDCAATVIKQDTDENFPAIVKDLSATGCLLWIDTELSSGDKASISIRPGKNITPPLSAEIEVVRCDALPDESSTYAVACKISEIRNVDAA